jgi:hypothetical protein
VRRERASSGEDFAMSADCPWITYLAGWTRRVGTAATLKRAMNLVDRPYIKGYALVKNEKTGETWERKRGSWSKTADAQRPRAKLEAVS